MTLPRTHDRILLASILAVASGVIMVRGLEGYWTTAGIIILVAGGLGMVAGLAIKIRAGR